LFLKVVVGVLSCCLVPALGDWYGPFDYPLSKTELREARLLGSLFGKGWKGGGSHPLTEFGKIHIIKKGWGEEKKGWGGDTQQSYGHGGGNQGWGWGSYGNGHEEEHGHGHGHGWGWQPKTTTTTIHYPAKVHHHGWSEPEKATKKGWFAFPKKSFGIHLKGNIPI
jgi:hypothetical protein